MKLFTLVELNYHYNDEYYSRSEDDAGKPVKAFKKRDNAVAAMKEMNEKRSNEVREDRYWRNYDDTYPDEFYTVVEVEVADEDEVTYASVRQEIEAKRKEAKELAQGVFVKGAKELFEKFPQLEDFSWTEFTDYFNDGDSCFFHVHSDYPYINGINFDELESGKEWNSKKRDYEQVKEPDPLYVAGEGVKEFLRQFEDDDMLAMFGDHVKITMSRGSDKPEVDDYSDHD